MTLEQCIFGVTFLLLLLMLVFWVLPKAYIATIHRRFTPCNIHQGVNTSFVNITDLALLCLFFGFQLYQWKNSLTDSPPSSVNPKNLIPLYTKALCFQFFSIGILLCLFLPRVHIPTQLGLSRQARLIRSDLIIPILVIIWSLNSVLVGTGYMEWVQKITNAPPLQSSVQIIQNSTDPFVLILLAIVACVGAPLAEELLFRGYFYPIVKAYGGRTCGILLTGVLFGVIHFNLLALPSLIVMGILLAHLYENTKTLWAPILVHIIFNSTTVLMQLLLRFNPLE